MRSETIVTFAEMADLWLASVEPEIKYSSRVCYANILNSYLLPFFGPLPVSGITRDQVIAYRMEIQKKGGRQGRKLSPKTVSSILSVFRRIMDFACLEKGCSIDNFQGIKVKQQLFKPLRVFSPAEQRRLTSYLKGGPDPVHTGILIALYMGLRIGEVCALKWENISLEDRHLHVCHTLQRVQTFEEDTRTKVIITEPKSPCSIRIIPIPKHLQKILKEVRANADCFLLTGSPVRFMEPRTLENRFHHILKICGIQNATFHTCRHTFATRCVELGFDIKCLSEILGHANVNITMNRYVHPSMEYKRKNMDKLVF